MFDVASEALKTSGNPNEKAALVAAIATLNVLTIAGKVDFTSGPVPNDAHVPVGGKLLPYNA